MDKIEEIKQKYPEYAAIPNDQLANRIYDKHYKDVMDRTEFDYRMGVKSLHYNFVDEMGSGFSLGTDDETAASGAASASALINKIKGKDANYSEEYDKYLNDYRLRQQIYREEHPKTAAVSRFVGGVAQGGPTFATLAEKAGPIVAGMATGGLMSGVEGFASGEGGAGERAKQGAISGTFGAVLGGLIPAAIIGGGKAIKAIKEMFGLVDVPEASLQRVIKAMNDDGLTPQQMADNFKEMAGRQGAIVDQGDNLRSLGAYVGKQPGKSRQIAQDFVNRRQSGQADRISNDIRKYVSSDDLYQSVDDLMTKRLNDAGPLYEKAYKKEFISSDKLDELLKRKPVQKALKNAVDIIETEGGNPTSLGFSFNKAGDVIYLDSPSMEALDYVKRGMDDVVEKYRDKVTGKLVLDTKGRAFKNLLSDYKGELVKLNPDYGDALKAYSGPSQSIEIINKGKNFQKIPPEQVQKYISSLGPEDKELYRIGVAQQMMDTVNKATHGANKARYLVGSPQKEKALESIFGGQKNFTNFLKALEIESNMHKTYSKVTGGSPTQVLQAEGNALTGLDTVRNAARGDLMGTVGSVLRSMSERMKGVNGQTTEEIARILFQDDPQELAKIYKSVSGTNAAVRASNRARMARLGLISPSLAVQTSKVLSEESKR